MFASLGRAVTNFFDGTLKGVIFKSVLLTFALFAILGFGMAWGLNHMPTLGAHWVNQLLDVVAPVIFIILMIFLGAPVAALFASLFLDEVAKKVEARSKLPAPPVAQGASFLGNLGAGARMAVLVLLVNLLLLPVDIELPGVAEVVTVLANGWLLGREYFELAALRHLSRASADALRRRHGGSIFAGGTLIALLAMVPVVNLIAPLFGAAFMVHMFGRYAQESRAS
jgi:CysZ protein